MNEYTIWFTIATAIYYFIGSVEYLYMTIITRYIPIVSFGSGIEVLAYLRSMNTNIPLYLPRAKIVPVQIDHCKCIINYKGSLVLYSAHDTVITLYGLTFNRKLFDDLISESTKFYYSECQLYTAISESARIRHGELLDFWQNGGPIAECHPIIDKEIKRQLTQVIERFLDGSWYREYNIPHACNILLYGPPGNGKSSIIRWVARKYKLNIGRLCANLKDSHVNLINASSPQNMIFTFEDINMADGDDKQKEKMRLTTVLNLLDGISESGRITIITTNYPETLPPEFSRSERIHLSCEITPTDYCRRKMLEKFKMIDEYEKCQNMSLAGIQSHCRRKIIHS